MLILAYIIQAVYYILYQFYQYRIVLSGNLKNLKLPRNSHAPR